MIDKGKYASHGAYIKRLPQMAVGQHQKPKLAVIHPLPSNAPRVPATNNQLEGVVLQSKTYSAKFKFQEATDKKLVAQELIQPFLYIEKVIKKQKVEQKLAGIKHLEPFITSSNMQPRKSKKDRSLPVKKNQAIPAGFKNLYDYEEQKRVTANKLFQKLVEADVHNLKDMFMLWVGKNRKFTPEIQIKQQQFVDFIKEVLPRKIAEKQIRRFFELYRNPIPAGMEKNDTFRTISIKALSFNYDKFYKSQTEVNNILSEKALKERYIWLKNYLTDFDASYPDLKQAMKSIKQYEQSLKNHFRQLYEAYQNPYEYEIENIKRELEKPIIKYDKLKKNELNHRIETLTAKNQQLHNQLAQDYHHFIQQYEAAILPNHDLFFTKRQLCKLLMVPLNKRPTLTRVHIEEQVSIQQAKKEEFLECLSELVVELDRDKKHLGEDSFTLDEVVQMVLMKGRKKQSRFAPQFILYASRKLIKQVKRQFLIKHQLAVQSLDAFPADQQISMDLLHTCFEMECSKVLLKNQIWQQLLGFIPAEPPQQSRLHQQTIEANLCLELTRRYFLKLDQRMKVQLNKSKQISLHTQNVTLEDFGHYGNLVEGVINHIKDYVEDDEEEQADKVQPLKDHKRVTFADVVDQSLQQHNFPEAKQQEAEKQQQQYMVKSILKSIFQPEESQQQPQQQIHPQQLVSQLIQSKIRQPNIGQNIQDMNSLAKSIFQAEALNTNSFDIRYFEKEKQKTQDIPRQTEVVRLGSSILLSNLPQVEELNSPDPLRISRLLMTTIDQGIQKQRQVVRQQNLEKSIREGVDSHYYEDKIKLENKPTIYDSQGKSKYSVLLPVGYYQDFVAADNVPEQQKWYLRPHHVQTLTQNPLSKKDNIIHTEYQSKLDRIPLKKRPDEHVIEQNVQRKTQLIDSLEQRLAALRKDLSTAQRGSRVEGAKVPPAVVDNYLSKLLQSKQDKDLQIASYQGVLYDLRRNERGLLNKYRQRESHYEGDPTERWWQRKDKGFNVQLRKERLVAGEELKGETKHRQYVDKLKNQQIY